MCVLKCHWPKQVTWLSRERERKHRGHVGKDVGMGRDKNCGHRCNLPPWSGTEIKTAGCGHGKSWILAPLAAEIATPPPWPP